MVKRGFFLWVLLGILPLFAQVRTGADVLLSDSIHLTGNRKIGIICNQASVLADGTLLLDHLRKDGVSLSVIFSPEHGFTGVADAGAPVASGTFEGIPLRSLYGERRRPDSADLAACDLLIYDLQDLGVRYYTYIATLGLCMQAAAKARIPFIVLDRPAPLNGNVVEGPVLDSNETSFVGFYPIPIRYGLTPGELARMIVGEGWLPGLDSLDLRIIPMSGWRRDMWMDQTGLPWVAPSPNIPTLETALAYPGTCLVEGCSVSEGRGTESPFLLIGAPWLSKAADSLVILLTSPGVQVDTATFTPRSRGGAQSPKFRESRCRGIRIRITDRDAFPSVAFGLHLLYQLRRLSGTDWKTNPLLRRLLGLPGYPDGIVSSQSLAELLVRAKDDALGFLRLRSPYLLY